MTPFRDLPNEHTLRCSSVSSDGYRCDLPDGHDNVHQANVGDFYSSVVWRTMVGTRSENVAFRAECLACGAYVDRHGADFCTEWLRLHVCAPRPSGMAVTCNVCGCYISDNEAHLRWHETKWAKK